MTYSTGTNANSDTCNCQTNYFFDSLTGQCISSTSTTSAVAIAVGIAVPVGILILVLLALLIWACLGGGAAASAAVPFASVPIPVPNAFAPTIVAPQVSQASMPVITSSTNLAQPPIFTGPGFNPFPGFRP